VVRQSKILLIIRLLKSLALVLLVPRSRICPKSTPSIEGPKDDLGSGSKEETMIHKDTLASVVVDQHVQALKSEENPQKSTRDVGVLDVSAGKTIATAEEKEKQRSAHERASVPEEEATESKHGSSVLEELLSIDIDTSKLFSSIIQLSYLFQ
jgi:hypothetical protein